MPYLSRIPINPMRDASREVLRNPHVVHGMVMHGVPAGPVVQAAERVLWRLDTPGAGGVAGVNGTASWPELLVLTRSRPDWSHVVRQAGWPVLGADQVAVRDYEPLFAQLALGREFAFRLTASPVQNTHAPDKLMPGQERRRDGSSGRGLRLAHRTAAHQLEWLVQRAPHWGFEIPAARAGTSSEPWFSPLSAEPLGQPSSVLTPSSETPSTTSSLLDEAPISHELAGPSSFGGSEPREVRISARHVYRFRKVKEGRQIILRTATFEGRLRVTDPDLLREKLLHGIGPAKAYGCGLLTLAPIRR